MCYMDELNNKSSLRDWEHDRIELTSRRLSLLKFMDETNVDKKREVKVSTDEISIIDENGNGYIITPQGIKIVTSRATKELGIINISGVNKGPYVLGYEIETER